MKREISGLCLIGVAAFLSLIAACGGDETTPPIIPSEPTSPPSVQAPTLATAARTPTPTAAPELERGVALDFAIGHRTITQDWEQFHADFDGWREGLVACDASSVEVTLRQFAGRFAAIAEAARGLPRAPIVRELADTVVTATEQEEGAIRHLRDNWQPGDPTVFEKVAIERSAASALRKEAEDQLSDLQVSTSQSAVAEFANQYNLLAQEWDDFHSDYDEWRASEGGCDRSAAIATLGQFSLRFGELTSNVRALPNAAFLRPVGELFVEAAEREEEALRVLRNSWRPFDSEVYTTLDRERNAAGKLRRQVVVGVQDFLSRYAIPIQELDLQSPTGP